MSDRQRVIEIFDAMAALKSGQSSGDLSADARKQLFNSLASELRAIEMKSLRMVMALGTPKEVVDAWLAKREQHEDDSVD